MLSLTLDEWLSKLEKRLPEYRMLLGTKRISSVFFRLIGDKKVANKVITVAGTNGKGSTVAFLEHILQSSGLSFGATCSPHLFQYNERIRVNGKPVSDEVICASFSRIEEMRGDTFLSFFEFSALAAFDIFSQLSLDVVVLEIGLGGRLDAMNIIDPDVAVITTVDFDHQQWLGDTIEEIAAEKAGIFRSGKPAIYGESNVPESVRMAAKELGLPLFVRDQQFQAIEEEDSWVFRGVSSSRDTVVLKDLPKTHLPFTSAVCAVQSVSLLGLDIVPEHIRAGLSSAWLYGRNHCLQIANIQGEVVTVRFDVAHNPQAGNNLSNILKSEICRGRRIAFVAMLAEKDFRGTLMPLKGCFDVWHVASVAYTPRALDGVILQQWLADQGIKAQCHPTINHAVVDIFNGLKSGDELVVFGSFHTVEEVFLALNGK